MEYIFKRKIYEKMQDWKMSSNGDTALLIQGARRVGKSTIAEQFAKNEYESYILIDFTKCSKDIKALFDDLSDLDFIFNRLQVSTGKALVQRKSVIIFYEVQDCPKARQAIKHLVADGRYDYIETGSLISIRQNIKGILIPSEEYELKMYPMDYEEFRWAVGDFATIPLLRQFYEKKQSLGDDTNRKLMRDFRLYMLVGGMPQAVSKYISTKSLLETDKVKRMIISLYDKDFMRIDPSGKASMMFKAIPAQLNKNASRYQVSSVTEHGRADRLAETLSNMAESMVVNMSYHVNDPGPGMAFHKDPTAFKMFLGDTGLFVTLAFWDKDFTENIIYQKLLSDKLEKDLGYVYENVVAQMLKASDMELYYHTFPTGNGKHNYEIDFLLSDGDKINPIEVKSSGYKTHASLDAFFDKFHSRIKQQYIVYTKDLCKDNMVTYLPVYMTSLLGYKSKSKDRVVTPVE